MTVFLPGEHGHGMCKGVAVAKFHRGALEACLHRQLKTKFCTYFLKARTRGERRKEHDLSQGACHYGAQCAFAHSCTELQVRTKVEWVNL